MVVVDQGKLSKAVDGLATAWDRKPADARLSYTGAKLKDAGSTGFVLRQREAETPPGAPSSWRRTGRSPADLSNREITTDEAEQVANDFGKVAVSGPVKVKAGNNGTFSVSPTMIGKSIDVRAEGRHAGAQLDPKALMKNAASAVATVGLTKPKNATVRLVDGRPKVIPPSTERRSSGRPSQGSRTGIDQGRAARTASVQLTGAKAEFSTAEAKISASSR